MRRREHCALRRLLRGIPDREGYVCGDGIPNPDCDEQCDDGNNVNGDGCQGNCILPFCGDGIVDPGEGCDDGNSIDGDGCEADCTLIAIPATSTRGVAVAVVLLLSASAAVLLLRRRFVSRS
jgi:cysteine-rich repeat protein